MKSISNLSLVVVLITAISSLNFTNVYAEGENDKACVLTIPTPDQAQIECKGEGTICSANQDCYRVFNPNLQ